MNAEHHELEGQFYQECARLLSVPYTYTPWTGRGPNRWNNRHAGNGRFDGFGTIRMFSPNCIHLSLRAPRPINCVVRSVEEVYALLQRHANP